jgi:hypothetical protein
MIGILLFFMISYEVFIQLIGGTTSSMTKTFLDQEGTMTMIIVEGTTSLKNTNTTTTSTITSTITTTNKANTSLNKLKVFQKEKKTQLKPLGSLSPRRSSSFRSSSFRSSSFRSSSFRSSSSSKNNNNKIIFYLHIHKSGGSSMCRQAQLQHLRSNYRTNCNVQKDNRCCGNEDSINAQIRYAKDRTYEFVACEKEMYDAMVTDYYDYVVTLRQSMSRYFSHWSHIRNDAVLNPLYRYNNNNKKNNNNNNNNHNEIRTRTRVLISQSHSHSQSQSQSQSQSRNINDVHDKYIIRNSNPKISVGNFNIWFNYQPDNFNIRMICGTRCTDIPKFQLTPELFDYTLQRISKFSHIIFLEDMKDTYETFRKSMGWNNTKIIHENKNKVYIVAPSSIISNIRSSNRMLSNTTTTTNVNYSSSNNNNNNSTVYEPFMTVLDDALYEFARRKYENKKNGTILSSSSSSSWGKEQFNNQELIKQYFQEGSSRDCTNPCCGECSAWR